MPDHEVGGGRRGGVGLTNSGGALPAGLAGSTDYWLIVLSANTFYFATSKANALAGTRVDITGAGTGTHSMRATMQTLAALVMLGMNRIIVKDGSISGVNVAGERVVFARVDPAAQRQQRCGSPQHLQRCHQRQR